MKLRSSSNSVIVSFQYGIESLDPLHGLSLQLDTLLENSDVGFFDGHEYAMDLSHGAYFMYGPNAENIFKKVLPVLRKTEFMKGAIANLRFGGSRDKDAPEIDVEI